MRKEAEQAREQYLVIYDRLISVFQDRPRDDWKKLIVFSRQWKEHSTGIFDRIKELSDKEESVDKKMALRKLFRALSNVNDEVTRYNNVLDKFMSANEDEWDAIVAVVRGDLQRGFFEHMAYLIAAAKHADELGGDVKKSTMDSLVVINTRLMALISTHDSVMADPDKLAVAAAVYKDLLGSITSIEDAEAKIGILAKEGRIDPAFLQISAKAYGAARDTEMTKDEAKWVSYKLYRTARDQFDRQQPTEQRIIKHLVKITDPGERSRALDDAVTPGPTRASETHDYMYSTPQKLHTVLAATVEAYDMMRKEAKKSMGATDEAVLPYTVKTMKSLRDEIYRRYL